MNENEKIKDSELVQVSGGNRQETYELGQYLYSKFPEEFDNPKKITLDQVYDCLLKKVPNFYSVCEPGDARTNTYTFFDNKDEEISHAEFMKLLQDMNG